MEDKEEVEKQKTEAKQNKQNKKIINIKIIVAILVVLIGIFVFIWLNNTDTLKNELYINSYYNASWGLQDSGYIIYDDGTIKKYDDVEKKYKEKKITKGELENLKKLSLEVDDSYPGYGRKTGSSVFDAGSHAKKIYNKNISKWIFLDRPLPEGSLGLIMKETIYNDSEKAVEILDFVNELYEKYISEE